MKHRARQSGTLLFAAIVLIVIVAATVTVLAYLNAGSIGSSAAHGDSDKAYFVARSGLERARQQYASGTACASLTYTNVTVGSGTFSTAAVLYNPVRTTVSAALTSAATTVTVVSTAGYSSSGRIVIDSEEMRYRGVTATTFTNVERGMNGTTAAAHSVGAAVDQNECVITSTGRVNAATRNIQARVPGQVFRVGSFTKSTAVAPVNQSVTGVGFRPVAVMFYWTRQTAANGFNAGLSGGAGFATASANAGVSVAATDNSANSDDGRRRSATNSIIFLTGGGPPAVDSLATLLSMDADGFTVRWTTNTANAYIINYIAFAGYFANTSSVGNFATVAAVGNRNVVFAAPTFQPDFVMFLSGANEAVNTNTANSEIGFGFMRNATARNAMVYAARDNVATNRVKRWQQLTNRALLFLNHNVSPPTSNGRADFTSMNANGFTINVNPSPGAGWTANYLAVKAGLFGTGSFNQRNGAGNQSVTGLGFKPQGLILVSRGLVASATVDPPACPPTCAPDGGVSVGAADRFGNNRSIWFQDRNVDPSDANMYNHNARNITIATGPATVNAQGSLTSFDNDGFTLNWTAADATAREILYWAIGRRDYADIQETF